MQGFLGASLFGNYSSASTGTKENWLPVVLYLAVVSFGV